MDHVERVLWILDYFPNPFESSMGTWAFETVKNLEKRGVHVCVLVPSPWIPKIVAFSEKFKMYSRLPKEYQFDNIKVYYSKCLFYPNRKIRTNLYFPYMDMSHRLFIQPFCKDSIKDIFEKFSPQIIHGNFCFPNSKLGSYLKKKYDIPLIFHERSMLDPIKGDKRSVNSYKKVLMESDHLMAPSKKVVELLKDIFQQIPNHSIIHDVFDISSVETYKKIKPDKFAGKKVILTVGALVEKKGHFVLMKALHNITKENKNIVAIIIGSGKQQNQLKNMITAFKLEEYVLLYGRRSHREVLETMSWCDFFVLPSWNESFGTVYSEAMSFGKPIIACSTTGISEVIVHGTHGLLVDPNNVESLADAIIKLLTEDELVGKMSIQAELLTKNVLNYDITIQQLIDVYNEVIYRNKSFQ